MVCVPWVPMSYIPTLVASLDVRLDELTTEIRTLTDAREALQITTPTTPPAATTRNGRARTRSRRFTPRTAAPATKLTRPAAKPKPELAPAAANGASAKPAKARRRPAATVTQKKRPIASLTPERLERLLADASSGLSAGALAERAGASYNRVLALLRELEGSGRVRRTGNRRTTLWLVITDQDRIAQRVAELEHLSPARRDDRTMRRGRARAS